MPGHSKYHLNEHAMLVHMCAHSVMCPELVESIGLDVAFCLEFC